MADPLLPEISSAIRSLFSSRAATTPISSLNLLGRLIASSRKAPLLRLHELHRFEAILESLSQPQGWEHGGITLLKNASGVVVMNVVLVKKLIQVPYDGSNSLANPKKRKRPVDEEAESQEGSEHGQSSLEEEEIRPPKPTASSLSNLSEEMKEIYEILQKPTAKGRLLAEQRRSLNGSFEPICAHVTKADCIQAQRSTLPHESPSLTLTPCERVHFRPLIRPHTDISLGHCSYLNTCYSEPTYAQSPSIPPLPSAQLPRPVGAVSLPSGLGAGGRGKEKAPCRYLHYEVDYDECDGGSQEAQAWRNSTRGRRKPYRLEIGTGPLGKENPPLPPQWLNCDLRRFDYSVLGKFHVILADPPWDIHMSLPYGTMTDDEMRGMPIPSLQDEGLLFLWVTGRAMEVGRECMRVWGYTRVDELIWVKINQLQRLIRTGRTGHWLNHTKEHMLVGVKTVHDEEGNLKFPSWVNRGIDTDVVVSEVRETSRKPDEVYELIERMCPGGRKVEIFGRKHNTRPGWLTLGNQLGTDQICEPDLLARIRGRYPDRVIRTPESAQTAILNHQGGKPITSTF
ncbi:MT-A70-domain-containing protein [Thelephora terrestris]|uniref:mRNA m(6)A methyltransferase n=1 Tax=Thelephora terrestris TaxID=56493 RepID=A0A9P6L307_9AGAM|nr:MT-A70-domain-containing protein [Thelephora terrestris]